MKTRRVCVMLDAGEAVAILAALAAHIRDADVHTAERAAASDAYALIATRTRALRGDLSDVATAPATPVPGNP